MRIILKNGLQIFSKTPNYSLKFILEIIQFSILRMLLLEYFNKILSGRFDQNSVDMAHSIEQTFFEFHASNRSTFMEMRLKISCFNAYLFISNYPVSSLLQVGFGSNLILKVFFPVIGCRKFSYNFILSNFFNVSC